MLNEMSKNDENPNSKSYKFESNVKMLFNSGPNFFVCLGMELLLEVKDLTSKRDWDMQPSKRATT